MNENPIFCVGIVQNKFLITRNYVYYFAMGLLQRLLNHAQPCQTLFTLVDFSLGQTVVTVVVFPIIDVTHFDHKKTWYLLTIQATIEYEYFFYHVAQ